MRCPDGIDRLLLLVFVTGRRRLGMTREDGFLKLEVFIIIAS